MAYSAGEPLPEGLTQQNIGQYIRPNGTVSYIDLRYPLDTWCNVTIAADPDIAGPGTILSFVIPAAITAFLAISRGIAFAVHDYLHRKSSQGNATSTPVITHRELRKQVLRVINTCDTLLTGLCDLQAFTGGAIIAAAFLQGSKLSFYHETMVELFSWLILYSFWTAQRRAPDEPDTTMIRLRTCLILATIAAQSAFLVRELVRQPRDWDFLDGKRCYLYEPRTWYADSGLNLGSWYGLLGTVIYIIGLLSGFSSTLTKIMDEKERKYDAWTWTWWTSAQSHISSIHKHFSAQPSYPNPTNTSKTTLLIAVVLASTYTVICAILFTLHQYAAYWAYAHGYEPIQAIIFAYRMSRVTSAAYWHKAWNADLISGDEVSWGFGQCLPNVMIMALLFSMLVTIREKSIKVE